MCASENGTFSATVWRVLLCEASRVDPTRWYASMNAFACALLMASCDATSAPIIPSKTTRAAPSFPRRSATAPSSLDAASAILRLLSPACKLQ